MSTTAAPSSDAAGRRDGRRTERGIHARALYRRLHGIRGRRRVGFGLVTRSVSLQTFGLDSLIEIAVGARALVAP